MTGRPSSYTTETADLICEQLAEGKSLRSTCKALGLSMSTVFAWLREREDFQQQYARAKAEAAEAFVEDITEITDAPAAFKSNADGSQSVDAGDVALRRLQVDARKWMASKLKPKKYGDKLEVENKGEMALTVNIQRLTSEGKP